MSHNFLGTRGRVLSIKSSLCSHGVDSLVGEQAMNKKKNVRGEGKKCKTGLVCPTSQRRCYLSRL